MQLYRLMGILVLLLQREKTTTEQLAERFEVSPRTIRRDVEALCQAGVPVSTARGRGGGLSLAPGYRLDPGLFTREELAILSAGAQGMGTVLPKRQAQAILDKLGAAPGEVAVDLSSFDPKGLSRLVEGLTTAIRENRLVRFTYASPQGIGPRAAEPCRLFYRLSAWYLLAYCRQRQDFRTFKLARITGLKVLRSGSGPGRFRRRSWTSGTISPGRAGPSGPSSTPGRPGGSSRSTGRGPSSPRPTGGSCWSGSSSAGRTFWPGC